MRRSSSLPIMYYVQCLCCTSHYDTEHAVANCARQASACLCPSPLSIHDPSSLRPRVSMPPLILFITCPSDSLEQLSLSIQPAFFSRTPSKPNVSGSRHTVDAISSDDSIFGFWQLRRVSSCVECAPNFICPAHSTVCPASTGLSKPLANSGHLPRCGAQIKVSKSWGKKPRRGVWVLC